MSTHNRIKHRPRIDIALRSTEINSSHGAAYFRGNTVYTVLSVIYAVILFMRIMRVVVRAHK